MAFSIGAALSLQLTTRPVLVRVIRPASDSTSRCLSSGDASPRGIEFLFSRNRLNVAISRAQTLAVVVASPVLVRTRCSSIEQVRLANVYCRAVAEGSAGAGAVAGGTL